MTMESLPCVRACELLVEQEEQRWLIESLWGRSAIGLIGGAPKCCKTWLGLEMAVSVATGTVRVVALFDGAAATLFDGRRAIGVPQCFVLGSAQTRDLRRHGSGVRCGLGMEAKAAPSDRSRSGP